MIYKLRRMGNEHETRTVFLAPSHKEAPDPRLRNCIEHSRAFVSDKIARSARQRTRDAEALQLSTRKLVGVAATPFGTNAEPRKKLAWRIARLRQHAIHGLTRIDHILGMLGHIPRNGNGEPSTITLPAVGFR